MELFLTIIFCIILFFWLLGRFGPLLLAWWLKRRIEKIAGKGGFYGANGFYQQQNNEPHKEGETYVENMGEQKKVVDKNVGEYVDFEETK
ncbi:MAG: DUF4834 family protein [Bacteroidales bacterium]